MTHIKTNRQQLIDTLTKQFGNWLMRFIPSKLNWVTESYMIYVYVMDNDDIQIQVQHNEDFRRLKLSLSPNSHIKEIYVLPKMDICELLNDDDREFLKFNNYAFDEVLFIYDMWKNKFVLRIYLEENLELVYRKEAGKNAGNK